MIGLIADALNLAATDRKLDSWRKQRAGDEYWAGIRSDELSVIGRRRKAAARKRLGLAK